MDVSGDEAAPPVLGKPSSVRNEQKVWHIHTLAIYRSKITPVVDGYSNWHIRPRLLHPKPRRRDIRVCSSRSPARCKNHHLRSSRSMALCAFNFARGFPVSRDHRAHCIYNTDFFVQPVLAESATVSWNEAFEPCSEAVPEHTGRPCA